jgi:hypothetical protein
MGPQRGDQEFIEWEGGGKGGKVGKGRKSQDRARHPRERGSSTQYRGKRLEMAEISLSTQLSMRGGLLCSSKVGAFLSPMDPSQAHP